MRFLSWNSVPPSRPLVVLYNLRNITLKKVAIVTLISHCSEGVRVCNRLSGYSGYSDIRKNLSVRIVI